MCACQGFSPIFFGARQTRRLARIRESVELKLRMAREPQDKTERQKSSALYSKRTIQEDGLWPPQQRGRPQATPFVEPLVNWLGKCSSMEHQASSYWAMRLRRY